MKNNGQNDKGSDKKLAFQLIKRKAEVKETK
jgi:hypothetical protein